MLKGWKKGKFVEINLKSWLDKALHYALHNNMLPLVCPRNIFTGKIELLDGAAEVHLSDI